MGGSHPGTVRVSRLGLFGGSFDPPHQGHLAVARAAIQHFQLDRLLLAPTGRQPLKPAGAGASFADRLHMVELLCALGRSEGLPLRASPLEAPTPGGHANYTVDTLRSLHAECNQDSACELFVVVGEDAFVDLRRWCDPDELLRLARWIVVSRPAAGLQAAASSTAWEALLDALALTPGQRARVERLGNLDDPTSATALRAELSHLPAAPSGETAFPSLPALPPSIGDFIRTHHLYGT